MKPNLLVQIALVVLSLILLLVAVLLPPKTREVATTIEIELNGERTLLSTPAGGGRPRPAPPEDTAEPTPEPVPTEENVAPVVPEASTPPTTVPPETNLK
jgi:hypothetical protein